MLYCKNDFEKELFELGVAKNATTYDPERRLVRRWRGKNGYHSRLSECEVHEIRASLELAYMLFNRDAEGDRATAYDILYRMIPLQDVNPARNTYGIWQYYLEEDLEEMNPPDWNWADFNGKLLLNILNEHSDKLTDDLKMRVRDSIIHACRAIIKRNVGPDYTNISIMGSYVTIFAGETLGISEFLEYGKKRLERLYKYNMEHGNFREFNSPTYTFICIEDLSRILQDVKDAECLKLASELNDLAWKTVALHYHPTTGQLAGPHDRAYGALIDENTRFNIERALNYKISLTDHERLKTRYPSANLFSMDINCPEKYVSYFTGIEGERVLDDTFAPGRMAYTYMNKAFTLGSLHREMAWNQHRNILGYFGTVERPVSMTARSQHDFWDYCGSYMSTVQDKGRVLSTVSFTSDGFDTHCCLDKIKDRSIKARDMRVRYVFEGAVDSLDVKQDGSTFVITHKDSGVKVRIVYSYARFGENEVKYEVVRAGNTVSVDAVLYSGDETVIKLDELCKAGVVSSVEIVDGELSDIATVTEIKDGKMLSTFGNLKVSITEDVVPPKNVFDTLYLERDGVEYKPAF